MYNIHLWKGSCFLFFFFTVFNTYFFPDTYTLSHCYIIIFSQIRVYYILCLSIFFLGSKHFVFQRAKIRQPWESHDWWMGGREGRFKGGSCRGDIFFPELYNIIIPRFPGVKRARARAQTYFAGGIICIYIYI